jgi:hypothetical protein
VLRCFVWEILSCMYNKCLEVCICIESGPWWERGLTSCLHLIYLSLYCSSLGWCTQPLESRLPDAGTNMKMSVLSCIYGCYLIIKLTSMCDTSICTYRTYQHDAKYLFELYSMTLHTLYLLGQIRISRSVLGGSWILLSFQ